MNKEKLNILFDATILVDGELGFAKKTGFFVVAQYLLKEFLKCEDVHVVLMTKPLKMAGLNYIVQKHIDKEVDLLRKPNIVDRLFLSIFNFFSTKREKYHKISIFRKAFSLFCLTQDSISNSFWFLFHPNNLKDYKNLVYFSPQTNAPWFIEYKKNLKKYTILYDCIPLKLQAYKNQANPKWADYFSNPDFYFFSISQFTTKDFCAFYNVDKSHVFLSYLAASSEFRPIKDDMQLKAAKEKYHIPQEKKYVFSLCTLEPRKNLIRAVTTFILFLEKNHLTNLIFVLGGCAWNSFENQLKKNDKISECYKKYVFHAGYVEDNDLPILYSNAEWFVYTSQYEGFGLPPLEAMQCGCPVITSNNSSLPEVVGDAGIMIDWDNDEQHIEAYENYYFNNELRKENSRKGLERARIFSWKKTAKQIIDKMNSLNTGKNG